jgi:hypothetical protein
MTHYKDSFEKPWKKLAYTWSLLTDGPRPSRQNVRDYEKLMLEVIKGRKNPKVLLLGATPEIRDMIARYPFIELTVADVNREMIDAMSHIMERKAKNEKHIVSDWLELDFEDHFDVAIADFIKGNLPYDKQFLLYRRISEALKPSGCLIERIFSNFEGVKPLDPDALVRRYSRKEVNRKNVSDLWNTLIFQTTEAKKATDNIFDALERNIQLPNIKEYHRKMEEISERGKQWHYGFPWRTEKRPILEYFEIEKKLPDDTVLKNWAYIFKLKPRKF